jgi:hypothetical protein
MANSSSAAMERGSFYVSEHCGCFVPIKDTGNDCKSILFNCCSHHSCNYITFHFQRKPGGKQEGSIELSGSGEPPLVVEA